MRVMDLVTEEERDETGGYDWYSVDPAVMYPVMLEATQEMLAGEREIPSYCQQEIQTIRGQELSAQAFADALLAPEEVGNPGTKRRQAREHALEGARRLFTALLREQNGGPIGVHILKNEQFKL